MIGGITDGRARELAREAAGRSRDGTVALRGRPPGRRVPLAEVLERIDVAEGVTHEFAGKTSRLHLTATGVTTSYDLLDTGPAQTEKEEGTNGLPTTH